MGHQPIDERNIHTTICPFRIKYCRAPGRLEEKIYRNIFKQKQKQSFSKVFQSVSKRVLILAEKECTHRLSFARCFFISNAFENHSSALSYPKQIIVPHGKRIKYIKILRSVGCTRLADKL